MTAGLTTVNVSAGVAHWCPNRPHVCCAPRRSGRRAFSHPSAYVVAMASALDAALVALTELDIAGDRPSAGCGRRRRPRRHAQRRCGSLRRADALLRGLQPYGADTRLRCLLWARQAIGLHALSGWCCSIGRSTLPRHTNGCAGEPDRRAGIQLLQRRTSPDQGQRAPLRAQPQPTAGPAKRDARPGSPAVERDPEA